MNIELQKLIIESNCAYSAMKANPEHSALTEWLKKPVKETLLLHGMETAENFTLRGPGNFCAVTEQPYHYDTCLKVECPTAVGKVPDHKRSYAHTSLVYNASGLDFRKYNRISFWAMPDCPGFENVWITVTIKNEGEVKYPRKKYFEGTHCSNIKNGCWNQVVWEIPYVYRDKVSEVSISFNIHGSQANMNDTAVLYYSNLELQAVDPEYYEGWDPGNRIAFCHSGYKPDNPKIALTGETKEQEFHIKSSETNKIVFKNAVETAKTDIGTFCRMDFSNFNECGRYILSVGDRTTMPFRIDNTPWESAVWKTINFFYQERCGFDVPGIHLPCHIDCFAEHPDGRRISVGGGWHDAGDLSQGQCNTSESAHAFLDMAETVKDKDHVLYERLLAEARWGLEWMMRTRFGDGYRCVWTTIGIWTKNIIGDDDDIVMPAYDDPFENFCGAAAEAAGARAFFGVDDVFAGYCLKCSREDFDAAYKFILDTEEKFPRSKISEIQFYGQGAFAAAQLYKTTKEESYLEKAVKMAEVAMACQQTEILDWDIPLKGFFYQSSNHDTPLAYEHRAHEQAPVTALALLCELAPFHDGYPMWYNAISLYAEYIKAISEMIEPYGLLPSAIYKYDDNAVKDVFKNHIQKNESDRQDDRAAQIKNGIRLSDKYYLRRFPVAFQFRGFHGVLLTKAKAVSCIAKILKDETLKNIATRQLEWVLGNNPFTQSTMYGEGYGFAPLYSEFANDITGELPVGIQTFENNDTPFYPMANLATYKEIWVHSSSRFLWTIADLY
ncbi:MAG: glycoside hydrolase family 9 protein [Oscillospiraceae bacterium]|nr:glycoside hydrolase family 9 protein [Oscillospiraceae bacterium]